LKKNIKTLYVALGSLMARLHGKPLQDAAVEQPLHAELFSADEMELRGKTLAQSHRLRPGRGPEKLLARLDENEVVLIEAFTLLMAAVKNNRRITPAGEWLLDNFYLIEEQIRTARRDFPKGYSRELPLLANGPSVGLPRVYDIALEVISHGDGRVGPGNLNLFVAAYQKVTHLKLGELWAIPIMLRLALIENLRRVGNRVAVGMIVRNQAEAWAEQMIVVAEEDPKSLILVLADMARANPPLVDSFIAVLARSLQGHSPALELPLTWIEQRLSESGLTIEQQVQSETQSQAANQVSISNSIGSLRFLGAMDWREFVETMSVVEQKLREDPHGTYARMDFATRDRYRHVIEKIAKHSRASESEVARKAIQLAHGSNADECTAHVGFFLIDKGLPQLEREVEAHLTVIDALRRLFGRYALSLYLVSITLLTLAIAACFIKVAEVEGWGFWMQVLIGMPALLGASQLAVALVNWLATMLALPQPLPRMDFSKGIPSEARTLVVVPSMLSSLQSIEELVEALEIRFLANRDGNLHFALLTDFRDADLEVMPQDELLLQLAQARIEALNVKYSGADSNSFFLFHRPRRWNEQEHIWMGYERKRGKLGDLNALLRTGCQNAFSLIAGNTDCLSQIKYVITLDTDTQLPRDTAQALAGTLFHPLNRAYYDETSQRVSAGYGILQPRMAVTMTSSNHSRYAQLCGSEPGIDPYTRAVSDVYQDLFYEGSFIGKGIYDVDAFESALKDRFPDNRILSHDLLEGCYARAGLLSDVQLYEDFPSRYSADVSRRHRWIRGDWQIAAWLLARVPGKGGERLKNPLSLLSQWKLFDNLRRSLVPLGLTTLFLLGWTAASSSLDWTLAVVGMLFFPSLITSLVDLLKKPKDVLLRQHLSATQRAAVRKFTQIMLSLACLPYEAYFSLDAIFRTTVRMLFTHKLLLEWNPSDASHHDLPRSNAQEFFHSWRLMWVAPVIALTSALALVNTGRAWIAAPVLLLWFLSPLVTWWISRPHTRKAVRLDTGQTLFLHKLARKTWGFFETFVTDLDHWLPPDNYQEHPVAVLAHRTSPTNMGLALLANLSAYDFGYLTAGKLIERTANTLRTMRTLDRYQGHFYNWYDTQSREPLLPRYVSSVDSGNLAGHLLTLNSGLLEISNQPVISARTFSGISDTMAVLVDGVEGTLSAQVVQLRRDIESAFDAGSVTVSGVQRWLDKLTHSADVLAGQFASVATTLADDELPGWVNRLQRQCQEALDDLLFLLPWAKLSTLPVWLQELPGFGALPTLRELSMLEGALALKLEGLQVSATPPDQDASLAEIKALVATASLRATGRIAALERLTQQAGDLAIMDYGFLYNATRHLMAVGFNVDEHRRDIGHYDLLASEARLTSFVAIAQGQVAQESWFALGRLLTSVDGDPLLLSWSGSMFEYLMPMLVMPSYENTLLDRTCLAAVKRQIAYGNQRGVPWGISESGYNTVDAALNYQYRAFGVPGLGLKRGLADDLVIAPYASALALMVMPEAACLNLQRLAGEGMLGKYGMYEAADYTPQRLPRGQERVILKSFMAHHQGMSLLSLSAVLLDHPMQKRFASDPLFQATSLLLQERIPSASAFHFHTAELANVRTASIGPEMPLRVLLSADTPIPEVQLLSNGHYHVMLTNAGGGYSRWKDLAVTRWREDTTRDNSGSFCYIRDVASGEFWSTAHQPTLAIADTYQAIFSDGRAEFRRRDHDYETHTEIVVSPEDDIELRRIRIVNRSRMRRIIEVTSYAEVVLASPAADALHPAFSNLFVQTEIIQDRQAILCTRRPRSVDEPVPWMLHQMSVHGAQVEEVSYETDRMRFIGRTRTLASPDAMSHALSGSEGSVLDPIVAIRYRIILEPEQTATIDVVFGITDTRDAALNLVGKYRDRHLAGRVFALAWTHSWVNLQQINATESDAQLYGSLASSVIYANPMLRADASVLVRNRLGQSGLWGYAISGDLPIVLLHISDVDNIELVRQLVQAHAYWRLKGLVVDLVIWNEDHAGYRQLLQEKIMGLIAASAEAHVVDRPGGIFVRQTDQIADKDRILFQSVARVIISDKRGTLAQQIKRGMSDARSLHLKMPLFSATRARDPEEQASAALTTPELVLSNPFGGFSADGTEYLITTSTTEVTPAPWVNVIANANFGTVISESGSAYTWSANAHEFRFTPWGDDPVCDSGGEAIYIRDEESGLFWSPTALPCGGKSPYLTRHGFGYSRFEHDEGGIHSELTVFVDTEASVKFSVLKVSNHSGRARKLSATGYVEWVLSDLRAKSAMHVVTEIDPVGGALCARNAYNPEFSDRIAFFDADGAMQAANVSVSGDRREFIGRNGTLANPAAMSRSRLSNKVGAGMDPCAAILVPFELEEGNAREIIFRLGAKGRRGSDDANTMMQRLRKPEAVHGALEMVHAYWRDTLGAVQVKTPDAALNVLANGWLLYQTLACRLWARSGYYQSGGAFGFRDQLQDVMALVNVQPMLMREHLLLCAAHQFVEGDVQHWWHPPVGRGVRTHCSDDFLWLPQAVCRYVLSTGDSTVLDESIHFIEGREVNPQDDSYYDLPNHSATSATLYQHCVRAILRGLRFGEHGLPLMGSGDWNDGMNLVGMQGRGESVWLGFFLYDTLIRFAALAHGHGDTAFAGRCRTEAEQLRRNLELHGWDGEWYRRAYFDDGTPLGSVLNPECRIDSIAQSWSVLSGAGDVGRSRQAMNSLDQNLVRRDDGLIQLLTPPFDTSELNPGYIKGYVPGVRENGGQYTHAAIWAAMAFAAQGDHHRAWALFNMINPIHHADSAEAVATYKVEPYVIAADVYGVAPHIGRGGWTWYTGSAGWMYRLVMESLLGLRVEADQLHFEPCLPAQWPSFELRYRYRQTNYAITVLQTSDTNGAMSATLDGIVQPGAVITLVDDKRSHSVEFRIPAA
jgi:cyclic beta-1,2-glucan synthetase